MQQNKVGCFPLKIQIFALETEIPIHMPSKACSVTRNGIWSHIYRFEKYQ